MINKYIKNHNEYRNNCLNLVPSENIISDFVKQGYISDLGHRYYFKETYSTSSGIVYDYMGAKHIHEMYDEVTALAKRIFQCEYANIDMHSGHLSNINILLSFCSFGDSFLCTSPDVGGYPGLCRGKLPKKLGLKPIYFPQNAVNGKIDLAVLESLIEKQKPKVAIISSSITLFPVDLKCLAKLLHEFGIPLVYDGSHPLGLIAAGKFQKPLDEGADYLIGSTHKSFPGPQGGIILGKNSQSGIEIKKSTDFVCVDNIHLHRIAALGLSLHEFEEFGVQYAEQIIKNSQSLSRDLNDNGINVRFEEKGFTESHQFLLDTNANDHARFTSQLEKCNIILDNSGRIGTSEITRKGLKEVDMKTISSFICRVFNGDNIEKVKDDVINFLSDHKYLHYVFN
jgi:glycine hydroxymethyltransferase